MNEHIQTERLSGEVDDPISIMTEHFMHVVTEGLIEAEAITIYRELSERGRLGCLTTGILTGLLSVMMAGARTDGERDQVQEFVKVSLDAARRNAELITALFRKDMGLS